MTTARRTVHLVSCGSYDEYRPVLACPTAEDATAVAARLNATDRATLGDDYYTEELPVLRAADVRQINVYTRSTDVFDDGRTQSRPLRVDETWTFDARAVGCAWRWVRPPGMNGRGGRLDVWGTDQRAVAWALHDVVARLQAPGSELRGRDEATDIALEG
jgi:hypothetical protein